MNDESRVKGLEAREDLGFLRLLGVALLGLALGALGTGYALRWKPIKPDFTFTVDFSFTVDPSATTIKMVDEQGKSVGEIRDWTEDPIVVRIQRHR